MFESCYIERRCLECMTSLFSFSIYELREENYELLFRKGLCYNKEGDIWGLSTPQHHGKNNKYRVTVNLNFVLRLI